MDDRVKLHKMFLEYTKIMACKGTQTTDSSNGSLILPCEVNRNDQKASFAFANGIWLFIFAPFCIVSPLKQSDFCLYSNISLSWVMSGHVFVNLC